MEKPIAKPRDLEDRLDCFGNFDLHDTICRKWCHLNIRCAIARDQHEQLEIMEDFFHGVMETSKIQ
jgi:hypothetical protein